MSRRIFAMLLLATLVLISCKRHDAPKPSVSNAPPLLPGPTTTQLTEEIHNKLLDKLEPFAIPDKGVYVDGPDGEKWIQYPSGILLREIKPADGRHPAYGQTVHISYVGTFPGQPDRPFDSSKDFTFIIGTRDVIKGLNMGVSTMSIGTKRQILIPANLAYGERGSPGSIPPNQALLFEVELLSINGEVLEMPKIPTTQDMNFMGPVLPPPDTAPTTSTKP